jgi:signal peptidase II
MPTLAWVAVTLVAVVGVDQGSKAMLVGRLGLNQSIRVTNGVRLRHAVNEEWWAHGIRSSTGLVLLWGVAVASGLLLLQIAGAAGRVGVAAALGGATANLLDRLVRGHVVDFVEIGSWPVFNVADAGIVAGVGLILTAPLL